MSSPEYTDPERAGDAYALPDLEVFQVPQDYPLADTESGWYWWSCFPGCLPDGDASGPFTTEEEALADARAE